MNQQQNNFSQPVVLFLANRLKEYLKDNCDVYKWDLRKSLEALNHCDLRPKDQTQLNKLLELDDVYQQTLSIRQIFYDLLNDDHLQDEQLDKLYFWIIGDWGRVNLGNRDDLLKKISEVLKEKNNGGNKFDFNRISSWSKVLSFTFPSECAIYDYRVIYSLNWMLYLAGSKLFLPFPTGRNSIINLIQYELQLYLRAFGESSYKNEMENRLGARLKSDQVNREKIVSGLSKKVFVDKSNAYKAYCDLLLGIRKELCLSGVITSEDFLGLTKVEMILFGIADTIVPLEVLRLTKSFELDDFE